MDFVSFDTWLDRRSHTGERWVVCGWASPQLTREEGWSRAGSVPTPFAEPPTRRRHSAARAEGLGSGANRVCHAVTPTRSWPISIEAGPDRTHVATLRGIAQHERGKRPFGPA